MAPLWIAVVCWLHNAHHWQLAQGGHSWVDPYAAEVAIRHHSDLTGAGFVAFDQYKKLLADSEGNISGPKTVIAGFGAGVTESALAVTPFESIKTTLWVKRIGAPRNFTYSLTLSPQDR